MVQKCPKHARKTAQKDGHSDDIVPKDTGDKKSKGKKAWTVPRAETKDADPCDAEDDASTMYSSRAKELLKNYSPETKYPV